MAHGSNRRDFLRQTTLAGVAALGGVWTSRAAAESKSPNEKLNLGIIGAGGRGYNNLEGVASENIFAICDVDDQRAGTALEKYPQAQRFRDFREMLEQCKTLDGVVVSTADHTHAPATMMAMRLGKHVYCEKPLTHSVHEARAIAEAAAKYGVATQMGTQIHAGDNYRRVVELVQSGAIGPVRDVHVWVGKSWSGGERPKQSQPVPATLSWDLWLGPAPERPYHSTYVPANWRRWWDFGGGTLGDMGCHYMDLPFWALQLKYPTSVESKGPPVHPETTPAWIQVTQQFPARGEMPACRLTWYDGDKKPAILEEFKLPQWGSGVLFIGDRGMLLADYGQRRLFPEDQFADFEPPKPTIPASIGHHQEWIVACKTGSPTTCHFGYAGPLTESVLLGNVAYRTGKKLEWDADMLQATNAPEAAQFVRREYRQGWSL